MLILSTLCCRHNFYSAYPSRRWVPGMVRQAFIRVALDPTTKRRTAGWDNFDVWEFTAQVQAFKWLLSSPQSFETYFSIFLRFEWVSINPPGQIFHFERIIHTGEGELCYSLHVPLIFAPRRPNDWQDPAWRVEENLPDAVESILRMSGWVAKCFGAKVERFVGQESHRKSRDLNLDSLNLGSTERFGKSELVWPHWVRWDRVAKSNIDKGRSSRHFL